ncbi:MAG TPA: PDZ domain-containing protein [Pirellulales bacterium]|nr:PDZ domain-containing protein [Pirellulales bacterium]
MRCVHILLVGLFAASGRIALAAEGQAAAVSFEEEAAPPIREPAALGVTLGKPSAGGVQIAGVMPNSPAAEAGLRPGDLLFALDDVPVHSSGEIINLVAGHAPNDRVRLKVDRKGLRGTLRATLASQFDVARRAALGATFSKSGHGGVRILQIVRGSPADKAGLKIGDRIQAVNGEPVSSYNDVVRLIGESQPGSDMKIDVDRYGLEGTLHASLTGTPQVFSMPTAIVPPPAPTVPPPAIFELTPADIDDQRGYGS